MRASRSESDAPAVKDLVDKALSLKPAPAPLHHVQLLLNTRNLLAGYDLLADEATAPECLAAIAASDGQRAPRDCDEATLSLLREVREAVRDLLLAHANGLPPDHEVRERIRAAAAAVRLSVDLDPSGRPIAVPPDDSDGVHRIAAETLAAITSAEPDQLHRLKACVNPDCGWVFYDTSRSRSGTWCAMNVCGARHKMERYRSRRR
ncbi:CGNR zinc finger domain-containing protein [Mycolicibacterium sp. 120270]|uniref:CGNR zinc finger domain-containing protein n=1 Tax=Mycolicibacterium sp. 120270 TaxID=3090600 RepID=UPI00299EA294|nr:CGNR zinc finger domain-containing protein [Mycolicibacterium sp. 120270]MDX1882530.1 CGNR zinc finger domain-containing protein [Mycolicibacterium sp. 120270]